VAEVDISYCDFSYANLTDCSIGCRNVFANTFANADLSRSTFTGAVNTHFTHQDFTNAKLVNCAFVNIAFCGGSFIGADLTGATFTGCTWNAVGPGGSDGTVYWDSSTKWPAGFDTSIIPLSAHTFPDYSNQTLTGVDLSILFHAHANFKNAILTDCFLSSNCAYADFSHAQLLGSTMATAYMVAAWANFSKATVDIGPATVNGRANSGIDLASLAHSNWQDAQITWSGQSSYPPRQSIAFGHGDGNFSYANFNGLKNPPGACLVFSDCNVSYSTFVGARLYDLDVVPTTNGIPGVTTVIGEATMCYCDFTNCQGGWFEECTLIGSTFKGAHLPATTFTFSNLSDVDLSGATGLTNASFDVGPTGNMHQADPTGTPTFGMTNQYDDHAVYNANTKLPPGIDLSLLLPANTDPNANAGQVSPPYGVFQESDFTGQTLNPSQGYVRGGSPQIQAYDGNFRDVTFTPGTYNNLQAVFNSNFRGAHFDGGTFPQGFYESNLGNPPPGGARGTATATTGPPLVRTAPTVHLHLPDATITTNPR
jgi:uncharacterized protein YjbI with pentapeptide repeats